MTGLIRQCIIQLHIIYLQKYASCVGQQSFLKNFAVHLLREKSTCPKGVKNQLQLVFQAVEVVEPENRNLMLLMFLLSRV